MIEIFKSERFGSVRTLMQGGEPWFCLADVCRVLELSNTTMVRGTLETDEVQLFDLHALNQSEGVSINGLGNSKATFVSEGGLYQIIIRSDKPQAKPFRKWVTSEVLPSIRKHGAYATDKVIDSILNNPDYGIRLLETLKAERAKRVEAERTNAILMHVNKTYTATEIAKELGLRSAMELNTWLCKEGVQYKVNDTWVLKADYASRGYVEIKQEVMDNGHVIYHRRFTQTGRKFLIELHTQRRTA